MEKILGQLEASFPIFLALGLIKQSNTHGRLAHCRAVGSSCLVLAHPTRLLGCHMDEPTLYYTTSDHFMCIVSNLCACVFTLCLSLTFCILNVYSCCVLVTIYPSKRGQNGSCNTTWVHACGNPAGVSGGQGVDKKNPQHDSVRDARFSFSVVQKP